MARCGCNPSCSCRINAEAPDPCLNFSIKGLGTPTNPYIVTGAVVTSDTIVCGATGLKMHLITVDTDTVDLEGDGSAATPLFGTMILTPDNTGPLAGQPITDNLIDDLGPNLYVSCEEIQDCVFGVLAATAGDCLEYDDALNQINVEIAANPNGIQCTATGLSVIPSTDANNGIVFGTDNRLADFVPPPFQVVDTPCIDLTVTGAGVPGDPQILSAVPIVDPNPCNVLSCGPAGLFSANQLDVFDAGALTPNTTELPGPAPGVGSTCFALETFPGCPPSYKINLAISDDPCNSLQCRSDGLFREFQRGESCQFQGALTNPIPAGALNAGQCTSFLTPVLNICDSSCCDIAGQFRIEFAGLNAFIDINSLVRVAASTSFNGTPFVPVGTTTSAPEFVEVYDTTLANPGPPGFKNFTIGGWDSFWNALGPAGCFTVQFRLDICVIQGRIRQFVAAPGSQGSSFQAIYQYAPICGDCNCNGFQFPPNRGHSACGAATN